jgi:hypothetical protein
MKAKFYNASGSLVWECTRDAKMEFNNATRAMRKGAVRGELYNAMGHLEERAVYLSTERGVHHG